MREPRLELSQRFSLDLSNPFTRNTEPLREVTQCLFLFGQLRVSRVSEGICWDCDQIR